MRKKSRILAAVLAALMAATAFTACGTAGNTSSASSEASTESSKSEASTTEESSEESSTEPVTGDVTEISWYYGGAAPKQPDAVIAALNEKSAKEIGVKVNFKFTPDAQTLQTALATGDSDLDYVFSCAWFANYVASAQKNAFVDLTQTLPEKAPKLYAELPASLWEGAQVNGKIYGIPVWKDVAATQFWIAREDILKAAGAEEAFGKAGQALSSLTPVLEQIKAWHDADPTNNKYSEGNVAPINFNKAGINGHDNMWDTITPEIRVGIRINADGSKNTTVQSYFTDAAYIDDLKTLKDWADRDLSNGKLAPTVEEEYPLATIGTAQGWDGAQFGAWGGPAKGYSAVVQPKTIPVMTTFTAQGALNCVGAGSQKVDAVLKYAEYINTDPTYRNMLQYGIEGTNWQLATEADMDAYFKDSLAEGSTTQEYVDEYKAAATGKVVQRLTSDDWSPWGFANASWKSLIPEIGGSADMYKNIFAQNDVATPSEILGFTPNLSTIDDQVTACSSIIKEYENKLQCGAVEDVDATVAELLGKLNNLGYQEIITEFQKQVDAFLAA